MSTNDTVIHGRRAENHRIAWLLSIFAQSLSKNTQQPRQSDERTETIHTGGSRTPANRENHRSTPSFEKKRSAISLLPRISGTDHAQRMAAQGMGRGQIARHAGAQTLPLRDDQERWLSYMTDSIINPSILNDVIGLERITKPALMKSLFSLGAAYSAQEISYRKIMGQLDDAGNTTTIAHYLDVLSDAGLLSGIQKYSDQTIRKRASSPRLAVHDTSLMTASYGPNRSLLLSDHTRRGHLVESAIGAYLLRRAAREGFEVNWWRDTSNREVDFVITSGASRTAIEVKSGRIRKLDGLDAFCSRYPGTHTIVVGSYETPLEDFLLGSIPLFR